MDNTLKGIIQRFEDEFPETRIQPADESVGATRIDTNETSSTHSRDDSITLPLASVHSDVTSSAATYFNSDSEDEDSELVGPRLGPRSRHASDVSLAAKALAKEEGAVHKIGQEVKRKMLESKGDEVYEQAVEDEGLRQELEQEHVRMLKEKLSVLKDVGDGEGGRG